LGGLIPAALADQPGTVSHAGSGVSTVADTPVPILSPDDATALGDDTTVRLITGDIVHLSNGKVTGVTPAERPDGTTAQYAMSTANSNTYVVPSDVASMVGQQLDRELFNVTKLVSYNLTADSDLPVIITQPNGVTAASAGQLTTLGLTAGTTPEGLSFQAAQANTSADQDPAPTWALIDGLAVAPTPGSPVSSQTKVWLDQKVQINEVTPSSDPASPDVSTTSPDVSTISPDETTTSPDDTTTNPDGITTNPDDTTTSPDNPTTHPGLPVPTVTPTPPDGTSTTPDSADAPPWMTFIGADQAHNQGYTGAGVTVAVIDTGIDANHPDLVGQVVAAQDFTGSGSTDDENGHGTFVASEIAGTGAASNGYYTGVAPGAKLINARVLDAYGMGSDSTIMAGMQWAAEQGADIINMSLGDSAILDDGSSPMSQLINQLSEEYGCLFVTAIGNDPHAQSVSSPSTADEALAVGAIRDDGSLAWFTSTGPRRGDGAIKPEIVAPGAHASAGTDGQGNPLATGLVGAQAGGDGYVSDGYLGTSMAAPLVAGAAALLKQADPGLDRTDIRARLMASAQPMTPPPGVWVEGSGIVDIPAALTQTLTTSPTQLNFGAQALPYPTSVSKTLTYTNASDTDVTLALNADLGCIPIQGLPTVVDTEPTNEATATPVTANPPPPLGTVTPTPPVQTPATPAAPQLPDTATPSTPAPPVLTGFATPSQPPSPPAATPPAPTPVGSALNVGPAPSDIATSAQTPEPSSWLLPVPDLTTAPAAPLPAVPAIDRPTPDEQSTDKQTPPAQPDQMDILPLGIDLSARSVTVPAGAAASVEVTVDPSAFASCYPVGYITATSGDTVLRTPLGWENSPQTYTITVTINDRNGQPDNALDSIYLMNVDTGEATFGTLDSNWTLEPVQTFTMPSGHYALAASDHSINSLGGVDQTFFLSPTITLDSDTSVTLNGTTAQPFTLKTDRPLQGDGLSLWAMAQAVPDGAGVYFPSSQDIFGGNHVYITPVADQTWSLVVAGGRGGPTVEAALDSCGQSPVTLAPITTLPVGVYHWAPVEVSSLEMPAAPSDQMVAVVSSSEQPVAITSDDLSQWTTAARKAGYVALIIASDQPSLLLSDAQTELDGVNLDVPVFVTTIQTGDQLRALESLGTINVLVREGPAYAYLLVQKLPIGQEPITLDATDANIASITVQRRAMGPNDTWFDNVWVDPVVPVYPSTFFEQSEGRWKQVPSRTYYVSADSLAWVSAQPGFGHDPNAPSREVLGPTLTSAGQHLLATVGTQVHSTALSPNDPLVHSANTITGQVPGLIDGLGQAVTIDQTAPITMNTTLTRLAATSSDTDEQLFSSQVPGDTIDVQNLDPGPQTYRLDQTTTADPAYWSLSTSTSTSWTWQSPSPSDTIVEPLRNVWYELPWLDANNAGSQEQPIIMHVGAQLGSDPLTTDQVTLAMSTDDGVTWTDVPLTLTDVTPAGSTGPLDNNEAMYTGTISAAVGQTVSLHSFVDGDGSQWDQTVIGAYSVTDTPQPMNPSLSCQAWSNVPDFTGANASHITGTAAPSMQLTILDAAGQALTSAISDDTGHWSAPTPAGTPSQQITLATYYGPTPVPSIWATTNLDTDIPAAPAITSPTDGTRTSQTKPTFTGTGTEPGATIAVNDSNGADSTTLAPSTGTPTSPITIPAVCTATVQDDLSWTCTPDTPLTTGDHTITATQTDPAGNVSDLSEPVRLTIHTVTLLPPVITTPIDQTMTNESTPLIDGSGYEPGDHVIVSDYTFDTTTNIGTDTILCTTLVQEDLSWTCTYTGPLADGDHNLTAAETTATGDFSDSSQPIRFTIRTITAPPPVITIPTDQTVTSQSSPVIAGSGYEPGDHVIVSDYTFDTTTGIGTTTILCDTPIYEDLSWTCTYTGPLADGDHSLTAAETDAAGNISDSSQPVRLTIDTQPSDISTPPADTSTPEDTSTPGATSDTSPDPGNTPSDPAGTPPQSGETSAGTIDSPSTPGAAPTTTNDSPSTPGTAPTTTNGTEADASTTEIVTQDTMPVASGITLGTTDPAIQTGGTTLNVRSSVPMALVSLAVVMLAAAFSIAAVLPRRTLG